MFVCFINSNKEICSFNNVNISIDKNYYNQYLHALIALKEVSTSDQWDEYKAIQVIRMDNYQSEEKYSSDQLLPVAKAIMYMHNVQLKFEYLKELDQDY